MKKLIAYVIVLSLLMFGRSTEIIYNGVKAEVADGRLLVEHRRDEMICANKKGTSFYAVYAPEGTIAGSGVLTRIGFRTPISKSVTWDCVLTTAQLYHLWIFEGALVTNMVFTTNYATTNIPATTNIITSNLITMLTNPSNCVTNRSTNIVTGWVTTTITCAVTNTTTNTVATTNISSVTNVSSFTFTNYGTNIGSFSLNREIGTNGALNCGIARLTPIWTNSPPVIFSSVFPPNIRFTLAGDVGEKFILKSNTYYIIQLSNRTTTASPLNMTMEWYAHEH